MPKVAIIGAGGRMGRAVHAVLAEMDSMQVGQRIFRTLPVDLPLEAGERPPSAELAAMQGCDIAIDVTLRSATPAVFAAARTHEVPVVSAVTGLDAEEFRQHIGHTADVVPVFHAENFALGVHALNRLLRHAADLFLANPHVGYHDVWVHDVHHNRKLDAPSGTATRLGTTINTRLGEDRVQYSHQRGGHVVGEHAITLYGAHEELTLQHRVADRMVFARGMVRAALFLAEQPRTPKLYGIDDLLDTAGS